MSFLNPVNEPVKRFSSTDAGAPQINYNARVAGDVKAVLKACLITGYGDQTSAGWSIVNEVDHVADFVSPSLAMGNFRLNVVDTLSSKTDFNCIKMGGDPEYISSNNKTDDRSDSVPNYKWYLFATNSSVVFVEIMTHRAIKKPVSRITFYGTLKSALQAGDGDGDVFIGWASGWGMSYARPSFVFNEGYSVIRPLHLGTYKKHSFMAANQNLLVSSTPHTSVSALDLWSDVYLAGSGFLLGKLIGILFGTLANADDVFNLADIQVDNRPCFQFFLAESSDTTDDVLGYGFNVAVYTDYWEV